MPRHLLPAVIGVLLAAGTALAVPSVPPARQLTSLTDPPANPPTQTVLISNFCAHKVELTLRVQKPNGEWEVSEDLSLNPGDVGFGITINQDKPDEHELVIKPGSEVFAHITAFPQGRKPFVVEAPIGLVHIELNDENEALFMHKLHRITKPDGDASVLVMCPEPPAPSPKPTTGLKTKPSPRPSAQK